VLTTRGRRLPREGVLSIVRRTSERSAARLAHQSGGLGVPSSNLGAPTKLSNKINIILGWHVDVRGLTSYVVAARPASMSTARGEAERSPGRAAD
jgi:hypothetical protein